MPARALRTTSTAALAVLALAVAACGVDDDGGADDTGAASAPDGTDPDADDEAPTDGDPPTDATSDDDATADDLALDPDAIERVDGVTVGEELDEGEDALATWQDAVPEVEEVTVTSSADGSDQPSLYLPPSGDGDQPLLVVVHSWSSTYTQPLDVPYASWAAAAGWGLVHPDFRGVNETPEATGSDLAVQDVIDAIDDAIERGGIDPDRVYVTGYSGGGMMSLLVAGRHPDRIAGAVAWAPVEDVVDWYAYKLDAQADDEDYLAQIEASCGGDPTSDDDARADCEARSPATHLDGARDAAVPIYIGHGIGDANVPASHGVRAFDALADEADRLGDEVVDALADGAGDLPDELVGDVAADTGFADEGYDVVHARRSGDVTLVLFDGPHDLVYHPGLVFLAAVDAAR